MMDQTITDPVPVFFYRSRPRIPEYRPRMTAAPDLPSSLITVTLMPKTGGLYDIFPGNVCAAGQN